MSKDVLPKMSSLPSATEFASIQKALLSMEKDEETLRSHEILTSGINNIKQLERQGLAIRKIGVHERRTGLYGKTILVFGKSITGKSESDELPANTLSNGK